MIVTGPFTATEAGSLDFWASDPCPVCGMVVTGSLESYTRSEVRAHERYEARKAGAK